MRSKVLQLKLLEFRTPTDLPQGRSWMRPASGADASIAATVPQATR